jgi:hypothetical protein
MLQGGGLMLAGSKVISCGLISRMLDRVGGWNRMALKVDANIYKYNNKVNI